MSTIVSGQIVDVINRRIFSGSITIENGLIQEVQEKAVDSQQYILPGFIDAHIHIESSMLVPSEFAKAAVVHGTIGSVSDPHEIGNVLGLKGIHYMEENGRNTPFYFTWGAPSCVPATTFETSGSAIGYKEIAELLEDDHFSYLSEVMNFPGVLSQDPELMKKIEVAKSLKKPIDGHAPGLKGSAVQKYIETGISTDHECTSLDEALEKLQYGMKIIIREGSAARNFEALHPLLKSHPDKVMFCSDDKHPNDLIKGHINLLVKRSIALGYDKMDVLRAACYNPVVHYGLKIGLLRSGDSADFILVDNLKDFNIEATYIKGRQVASKGKSSIQSISIECINNFHCDPKSEEAFQVKAKADHIHVIKIVPDQLITEKVVRQAKKQNNFYISNPSKDLLKLAVVNRYQNAEPAIAFVEGFGIKKGAIASSVAHDSHNIIAAGTSDGLLARAVNLVIESEGGVVIVSDDNQLILPLPIAGLMSDKGCLEVSEKYEEMRKMCQLLGTQLNDPFMTLSFLALLVIPSIKLSDKGLFDAVNFEFISLAAE